MLRHLVANVELSLRTVDAAVITVPATFGIKQRRATEAAAHQAGIQVPAPRDLRLSQQNAPLHEAIHFLTTLPHGAMHPELIFDVLQNVKLMNEPSAAAFTYAQSVLQPMAHDRHVLVMPLLAAAGAVSW